MSKPSKAVLCERKKSLCNAQTKTFQILLIFQKVGLNFQILEKRTESNTNENKKKMFIRNEGEADIMEKY